MSKVIEAMRPDLYGAKTPSKEDYKPLCIGCDKEEGRYANKSLCLACWADAEGQE